MRQIKFRAYNELTNTIHEVVSIWNKIDGTIEHLCVALDKEREEVDTLFRDFKLMQFTGLTDSNGNEIYEGDIILQKSKDDWHSNVNDIYVIEFGRQDLGNSSYQQTIGWNATSKKSYQNEDRRLMKGINDLCINHPGITAVVIGNIHENPELLNV